MVHRSDVVGRAVFEVLESEKHVTSSSGMIVRLNFRGRHWVEDFC